MFERFTERARQVVVLAQEEARTLKHNYIGTEHILLGLIREEEGLAARVLEALDIELGRVRAQIVRIVGSAEEVTTGQIPFTPRARKVLELALREALSLGHNYIGTEHILLGLVRENEGVAARVLLDFDADAEKIRSEVTRMLSGPGGRRQGVEPLPRELHGIEAWIDHDLLRAEVRLSASGQQTLLLSFIAASREESQVVSPSNLVEGLVRTTDPEIQAVLQAAGLNVERVDEILEPLPAPGSEAYEAFSGIARQLNAQARRVLDLALAYSLVRAGSPASPLSLLAGLAQIQDPAMVDLLHRLGIEPELLRDEIARRSGRSAED